MTRVTAMSAILLAALALPARAAQLQLPVETAGAEGSVRALVLAQGGVAGAVLWPAPHQVEGQSLPPGTLLVAAQAVLQAALTGIPEAQPILELGPGNLAVGAKLPDSDPARLEKILARLATPATPPAQTVATAARAARTKRTERWADPLEKARVAALGILFPGAGGPWNAAGTPQSLERVDAAAVTAALASVRGQRVQVRAVGPAGLAVRLDRALQSRLGGLPDVAPAARAQKLPDAVIIPGAGAGTGKDGTAVLLAFAFGADEATSLGPVLAVMYESLREGQGSLPQRLSVAVKNGVTSELELMPVPGGGGVLLLGAKVARENAGTVWRVLEGTVTSLRAMPFMDAAVYRARQRLDEQAAERTEDPAAALFGLLRAQAWSWPPADRERPLVAADIRQAAVRVLAPERRAAVAAGALTDELLTAEGLKDAARVDGAQLDPVVGAAPGTAPQDASNPEGTKLATELVRRLVTGPPDPAVTPFEASYRVREKTPLGTADVELHLQGGPAGATVELSRGTWRMQARGAEEGAEARLPGSGNTAPLPEPDRIPALVYREPAILAAAVARGILPGAAVEISEGDGTVPALRVELGEGTVLLLVLDPQTRMPATQRVWYLGHDAVRPPDEDVRYNAWSLVEGVRLVSSMTVRDGVATPREVRLVTWTWKVPVPQP